MDPGVVRDEMEGTFALARQLQDPCWEGVAAKAIGLTHVAQNHHEVGLRWLVDAGNRCGRVTDSYAWVDVDILVAEAQVALELGDAVRAESVSRRAIAGAAKGSMDDLLERALRVLEASSS